MYLISLTPDPAPSVALRATATGELLFQPAPFAAGVSWALAVGGVVSTRIAVPWALSAPCQLVAKTGVTV